MSEVESLQYPVTPIAIWHRAWRDMGVTTPDPLLLEALIACYRQPQRCYHSQQHLQECFELYGKLHQLCEHPSEVALALWFHDAIYDVQGTDNETKSAAWAHRAALEAGLDMVSAERIVALVLATRHAAQPETLDQQILVDIDLAILGAEPERFDQYECQIRAEYAWVPEVLFRQKRRSILEEFLKRANIYSTAHCQNLLEARARRNLQRSIESFI
jgi:predicted metal-dependent HD superfamily phosphohydrolase